MGRRYKDSLGTRRWFCKSCSHCGGHGAVVLTVPTATGREARLCVAWKGGRKRSQPEQQNHENGNNPPHRRFLIYGNQAFLSTG